MMCFYKQRIRQLMLKYAELMFGMCCWEVPGPGLFGPLGLCWWCPHRSPMSEGQHVQQIQPGLPVAAGWRVDYTTCLCYHHT